MNGLVKHVYEKYLKNSTYLLAYGPAAGYRLRHVFRTHRCKYAAYKKFDVRIAIRFDQWFKMFRLGL
uniref:Uncharacterized protein n=1 Tax=Setaria digitata TaxID=48799 RepID=A0A915Q1P1_9BILA